MPPKHAYSVSEVLLARLRPVALYPSAPGVAVETEENGEGRETEAKGEATVVVVMSLCCGSFVWSCTVISDVQTCLRLIPYTF